MLVQCPNCKNLFDLPETSFAASKFRCSSCKTVWENDHKLKHDAPETPKTTIDWILLWSALGLLAVALYVDLPRVSLFLTNFRNDTYPQHVDPFHQNKIESDEEKPYRPESPTKDEQPQSFNLTETEDDPNA